MGVLGTLSSRTRWCGCLKTQNLFIRHQASLTMFEPDEESTVLEIVCGLLNITSDEMMEIGDTTKKALFDPSVENEEMGIEQLKGALKEMSNEQAVIAGMFLSGLLRYNLAQQYMQAMKESDGCQCQNTEGVPDKLLERPSSPSPEDQS